MLEGKKVLIAVTGGIGAYKVCSLINKLKKEGAQSKVMMTKSATEFVTPLTFQSLSNSPVYLDTFEENNAGGIEHIDLADWCNLLVIVPATANTISKIACGIADNLVTTVTCALEKRIPVLIVPAMNCHMWENEILQKNIALLRGIHISNEQKKYNFVGPRNGKLACGYEGEGDIDNNEIILQEIKKILKT